MHFTHELCKMGTILSLVMNITEAISSFYPINTRDRSLCHILCESAKEYTRVSLAFLIFTGKKRKTREMVQSGRPMNRVRFIASKGNFCSLPSVQDLSWLPSSLLFSEILHFVDRASYNDSW